MQQESNPKANLPRKLLSWLPGALGILCFVGGFALDLLPGATPGINLPQWIVIGFGALLMALALLTWGRRSFSRRQLGIGGLISIATLFALEMALAATGVATYLPGEIPEHDYSIAPWWVCDESGCHFEYAAATAACEAGALEGRQCVFNRQGFFDEQDFVISGDMDQRQRIMTLGDSYTQGYTADIGFGFVATLERRMPEALVWNLAVMGSGTNQALASLRAYGPLMRPDVILLGFYVKDFEDNLLPIDSWFAVVDGAGLSQPMHRKYKIDPWGNLVALDLDSILYYQKRGVLPPNNALERALAPTRLGTLALRLVDALGVQFATSHHELQRDATREYLRQLRDEAAALGSELLVLLIPDRNDIAAPRVWHQMATALFAELRIPFIEARHWLELESDYFPVGYWDIHWTTAGHQKIGNLLSDCLIETFAAADLSACEIATLP